MYQQINFFELISPPKPPKWPTIVLLQISALVLIVMILIAGAMTAYVKIVEHKVTALTEQQTTLQASSSTLQQTIAGRTVREVLQSEIDKLTEDNANRKKMISGLAKNQTQGAHGFSEQFAALGYEKINGLWLNNIHLQQGNSVELSGQAYQGALIPSYLEKIGKQPAFKGLVFYALDLKNSEDNKQLINFSVKTENVVGKPEDDKEESEIGSKKTADVKNGDTGNVINNTTKALNDAGSGMKNTAKTAADAKEALP